ncbi:MAG: alpha/beta hydrolase [Ruminococcus sp.]|nr:alpha/beta hydrolase [Ruminococcus sp.]
MKGRKRLSRRTRIIIAAAVILILIPIVIMIWLPTFIMTGKRQTLDEALKWQSERYDTSFYESIDKTDYTVKSFDGYELHVQLLKNPEPTDKYIIISHGYTDNRCGALKYVPMYLELGYNCIIYDLRGHGENDETFTTYGIREGEDIAQLVKDTRERYSSISQLGLHGESLGAASTVTSLKYKPKVDFAVADCGFSDIENVLKGGFKSAHLPSFLFELADLGGRVRYGFSLDKMRPIDSLDDNTVPILFIHGAEDSFITPKNSEDMQKRTKGMSELHIIKGAAHAESILTSPEEYKGYVKAFLEKI